MSAGLNVFQFLPTTVEGSKVRSIALKHKVFTCWSLRTSFTGVLPLLPPLPCQPVTALSPVILIMWRRSRVGSAKRVGLISLSFGLGPRRLQASPQASPPPPSHQSFFSMFPMLQPAWSQNNGFNAACVIGHRVYLISDVGFWRRD